MMSSEQCQDLAVAESISWCTCLSDTAEKKQSQEIGGEAKKHCTTIRRICVKAILLFFHLSQYIKIKGRWLLNDLMVNYFHNI